MSKYREMEILMTTYAIQNIETPISTSLVSSIIFSFIRILNLVTAALPSAKNQIRLKTSAEIMHFGRLRNVLRSRSMSEKIPFS